MLRIYFNKIVELHSNPEELCMGIKGLIWSFSFDTFFKHGHMLMQKFTQNAAPDVFREHFCNLVPVRDYESRCFKIVNKHYLCYIKKAKEK